MQGSTLTFPTCQNKAQVATSCLDMHGVAMRYGDGAQAVTALERIDLSIAEREFVTIVGPSGCGKSTLLYLVGGFLQPSSGSLLLRGLDLVCVTATVSSFPLRKRARTGNTAERRSIQFRSQ